MPDVSDDNWKQKLTPEQYHVLREKGTEVPGTGKLLYNQEQGMYVCAACGSPLFSSETKYDSTTPGLIGWPSFSEAASKDAVELVDDNRYGMYRTEVVCKTCGGHLGHLFADDSSPSGQHYCVSSVALEFKKS
ncbi:MAG TPA: peptide-methionine (R)-S-oxide reductase MsrB [Candidatus Saccharimonadales bacterium]|nr:peptide-methionine (R)-S-oxide reductase MsrB [Candidatus Saccharimonadales bacterium]